MPITHTNRKGKTYYLHQMTTKKGTLKYHFALSAEGYLVNELPAGYEIYENPNSQVFLRRSKPQQITEEERAIVETGARELAQTPYTIVDIKNKAITIYVADQIDDELLKAFALFHSEEYVRAVFERQLYYEPMMRFVLQDKKRRLFSCERFNYLGRINDWMYLAGPGTLTDLVSRYVKHLGSESFFELY